jgi:hypothetical protein
MHQHLVAATASFLLAAAAPAAAAPPIMPLAEVQPGMRCTGLTVVRGADIASFDVEIVDVVPGDPIAAQPLLLVRVSGPVADPSGIAEGFSGSPVVCDGRIAGAIAYGTGDYGNQLGFATPIEAILGEPVSPPPSLRRGSHAARRARPLATPLAVTGLSPAVSAPFARAARKAGLPLSAVPAAPLGARFPAQELQPGSSMSLGLSSGDVALGAVGTVSYVDGTTVWGFGHPYEGAGRRSLFLQDAWVYTVIDNPLGVEGAVSFKLAAPGHDLGTLTSDGRDGVAGVLGVLPPRVPLRIVTRDADTGAHREIRAEVADETDVGMPSGVSPMAIVAPMALAQAAYTALDGSPAQQSARMCVRIGIRELKRPASFCNRYVGAYGIGGALGAPGGPFVADVADALLAVDEFAYGTPHIASMDVAIEVRGGLRQAFLRSIRAPRTLHRGQTVTVRLELQRYRGGRYTRTARLRIPRDAPLGKGRVTLVGTPADGVIDDDFIMALFAAEAGNEEGAAAPAEPAAAPRSFAGLARRIASIQRPDGVTVQFGGPGGPEGADAGAEGSGSPPRPLLTDPEVRISGRAGFRARILAAS